MRKFWRSAAFGLGALANLYIAALAGSILITGREQPHWVEAGLFTCAVAALAAAGLLLGAAIVEAME